MFIKNSVVVYNTATCSNRFYESGCSIQDFYLKLRHIYGQHIHLCERTSTRNVDRF